MTELMLLDTMCEYLRAMFKGYTLLNKSGVLQEVKIFPQYVPQPSGITVNTRANRGLSQYAESDYDANFPCIVVRLGESVDQEERRLDCSRANLTLTTGIYDDKPECQGYRDILNIHEKIREKLLLERILGGKYLLEMPIRSKLLDAETWPVYFGELSLIYDIGRPVYGKEYVYRAQHT